MRTITNTSITNLILVASLSSSVVNLGYELENQLTPQKKIDIEYNEFPHISNWKENSFNIAPYYRINNDQERVSSLISITNRMLKNSQNIDSEFVDIVNDNFWDLI